MVAKSSLRSIKINIKKMKKVKFIIIILNLIFLFNFAKAESNFSLKDYLDEKSIEEGSTQIYLLNRCSAVYAYASGIILKTDAVSSKNFIEISNNLLFRTFLCCNSHKTTINLRTCMANLFLFFSGYNYS